MEQEKWIKVNEIKKEDNTISFDYEASEDLHLLLNIDNKLKIEYNTDITKVPDEVAVIPFITGILPMIYLEDIKMYMLKKSI